MKSNSWVVVRKATQEVIMETWNKSALTYLKPEFEAIPTYEYLINFNKQIKNN